MKNFGFVNRYFKYLLLVFSLRMKIKRPILFLGLMSSFLLPTVIISFSFQTFSNCQNNYTQQISESTIYSPIQITGDEGFITYAAQAHWIGNGSKNYPIEIRDLKFDLTSGIAISISETNLFFIITDCQITGGDGGIYIDNVKNAMIKKNIITSTVFGISLQNSMDCIIIENTIQDASWSAIRLRSSLANKILFNRIESNRNGIFLESAKFNAIIGNNISNNRMDGIFILYSVSNHVQFNSLMKNNVGNGPQAQDDGKNNIFKYNHWADWLSPDFNEDGIVDSPYALEGSASNIDVSPLMHPANNKTILTPPIIYSPDPDGNTRDLSGIVEVRWIDSLDMSGYNCSYSVYLSWDKEHSWVILANNLSFTEYQWNTENYGDGEYALKIIASNRIGIAMEHIFPQTLAINNKFSTTAVQTPIIDTIVTNENDIIILLAKLNLFIAFLSSVFIINRKKQYI